MPRTEGKSPVKAKRLTKTQAKRRNRAESAFQKGKPSDVAAVSRLVHVNAMKRVEDAPKGRLKKAAKRAERRTSDELLRDINEAKGRGRSFFKEPAGKKKAKPKDKRGPLQKIKDVANTVITVKGKGKKSQSARTLKDRQEQEKAGGVKRGRSRRGK